MADLIVAWEDQALDLLDSKDRYTRSEIRNEFRRDPKKDAIEFDPVGRCYLTPVSDNRFSVVWQLIDQQALVRAIVPLNINLESFEVGNPDALGKLKEYVERAVKTASKK
jgi:hypothetical protein